METSRIRPPKGKFWPDTFFARKTTQRVPNQDLRGKNILLTGGTDGIGRVAAERFVQMGANLCVLGRDPDRTQRVVSELSATPNTGEISKVLCDLSLLDQVRRAAAQVLEAYEQIDLLINCAGTNVPERRVTPEGYEFNFVVNYLAPFLLTELLVPRLKANPQARILHLTSAAQEVAKLDFDDLHSEKKWTMLGSYAQAKLCLIMHGQDLAKRLKGSGVTCNALNPGFIQSKLSGGHTKGLAGLFSKIFGRLAAPTWVGGERIVAAVLGSEYQQVSGKFIYEDMLLEPNPLALDEKNVDRLMQVSRELIEPWQSEAPRVQSKDA